MEATEEPTETQFIKTEPTETSPLTSEPQSSSSSRSVTYLRFLLPSSSAGSVIGKGGSVIRQIMEDTNTNIRLSDTRDTFPGTRDRIGSIQGFYDDVIQCFIAILQILEETSEDSIDAKIVLPGASVGSIIGKGGENIRGFSEQSGARFQISSRDAYSRTYDRYVTITGTVDQKIHAVELMFAKLHEQTSSLTYQPRYSTPRETHTSSSLFDTNLMSTQSITLQMQVADDLVGPLLGRGGKAIQDMQAASGAVIRVSQKDDFVAGTSNRTISISGPVFAAQAAQLMLAQRIQQINQDSHGIYTSSFPQRQKRYY